MGLFRNRKSSASTDPVRDTRPESSGFPRLQDVRGTLAEVREEAGAALAQAGILLEADIAGSAAVACPAARELPILLGASGFSAGLFRDNATLDELAQFLVRGPLRLPIIKTWNSGYGIELGHGELRISEYAFRARGGIGMLVIDSQPENVDSSRLLDIISGLEDDADRAAWAFSVAHRGYGQAWLADTVAASELIEADLLIEALVEQLRAGA